MGIVNISTDVPAQIGVAPRRVKIVTTDNLSTVTTAGYLNPAVLEGYTIYKTDVLDIWYGATIGAGLSIVSPGTYEVFTPTFSNGVITLTQWANPGDVLLPVVSGDFAVFNGTTGQIKDSGSAPSAASQAFVVMSPGSLTGGDIPKFNDANGTLADSGVSAASLSASITQLGSLQQTSVTLNQTAMAAAFATPQVLIPAVAGKVAIIHSANVYTNSTGQTPFATGTAPIIQYGTTVHGGGTIATGAGLVAGDITAGTSQVRTLLQAASAALTGLTNTAVTFSNATAGYTGGTGASVTFTLVYELITATI